MVYVEKWWKVEDYVPAEWFSPMLDGSNEEGKFKTRKGIVALKRGNLQVLQRQILNSFKEFKRNFNNSGKLYRLQCLGFIPLRRRYGRVHFVQVFVFGFRLKLLFLRIIFLGWIFCYVSRSNLVGNLLPWDGNDWMMSDEVDQSEFQVFSTAQNHFRLNVALHSWIIE